MKLNRTQQLVAGYVGLMLFSLLLAMCGGGPTPAPSPEPGAHPAAPESVAESAPPNPFREQFAEDSESGSFTSDASFDTLTQQFAEYLGTDWTRGNLVSADFQQLAKHLDADSIRNLENAALFVRGDHRHVLTRSLLPDTEGMAVITVTPLD